MSNLGSSAPGGAAPPRARPTTVLFAEVTGAPAARTLDVLGQAAALSGGRVLHTHANGVLALFSTPDAAAAAAVRMHSCAETLLPAHPKLDVRIGFHAGQVGQRKEDVFGDTVNLALQLAAKAKAGQILTSHDTASGLAPDIQELVRPSGHLHVRARKSELPLGELVWQGAVSQIVSARGAAPSARAVLRLAYRDKALVRRREGDAVSIGRGAECDLHIDDINVSRRHCSIERRGSAFTLRDHSMNGTFVAIAGQVEVRVSELPLGSSGTIALGQPAAAGGHVVQYACEFSK